VLGERPREKSDFSLEEINSGLSDGLGGAIIIGRVLGMEWSDYFLGILSTFALKTKERRSSHLKDFPQAFQLFQ